MSVIAKEKIIELIESQELEISPNLDAFQLQPASIDLRLGWSFYIPYTWKYNDKGRVAVVDDYVDYSTTHENFQLIKLKPGQYFEILPGEMIIAATLEKVSLKTGKHCGILYGRNSSARRGLTIESGMVNPHFSGPLTIPISNQSHHVLKIYPGERLVQLVLHDLSGDITAADAAKHGLQDSKYDGSTPYGLDTKLDSYEELDLLKTGQLDEIKQNFTLVGNVIKKVEEQIILTKKIEATETATAPVVTTLETEIKFSETLPVTENFEVKSPEITEAKDSHFPYLPAGHDFQYVGLDNLYMEAARQVTNENSACSWWPTGAVLVKNGVIIGRGANAGHFEPVCPRYEKKCPTGEGYEHCQNICQQTGHGEVSAINNAYDLGIDPMGADIYLFGHWWVCEKCWDHIIGAGIQNVYLLENASKIFTREAREKVMQEMTDKVSRGLPVAPKDAIWQIN